MAMLKLLAHWDTHEYFWVKRKGDIMNDPLEIWECQIKIFFEPMLGVEKKIYPTITINSLQGKRANGHAKIIEQKRGALKMMFGHKYFMWKDDQLVQEIARRLIFKQRKNVSRHRSPPIAFFSHGLVVDNQPNCLPLDKQTFMEKIEKTIVARVLILKFNFHPRNA